MTDGTPPRETTEEARREPIPDAAWRLLVAWLPAADDVDRPQMQLATVDADGRPDARTVLMTSFDRHGLSFHTDATSRKAVQLVANPAVALVVLWPGFTRQLTVQGTAEPAPADETLAAFEARSPYLRQLAWQNTHEFAALPVGERRRRWAEFAETHDDALGPPPTWAGFVVRPRRLTFWQSAPDTASRRDEWSLGQAGWSHGALAG
ncbi:pyridoxine/pyridoxamine 5'-phosphate oxidase [Frigoribacterium sp. 2-23]|uniref:pyridoxine/pyridoxamine 5'-phosphate oxidase n=1 Tax=Frigoribacterium sp. 2-23 TaxID=3415006 RepID=UPI003C6FB95F